ncbi:MAG: AbrB/MazE/SpoVT family DNA-binding domain-containing protein [Candidatus Latescibacteria bacterium]|nr:AbrB/MazE/SpoVT family DNA-binding domain-containing protein [Candidatus Latescibacterota bacterium]
MASVTISQKGWVVIPAELRRKYQLTSGTQVQIVDYGGVLSLIPSLDNPIDEVKGLLKGDTSLTQALLEEHRKEQTDA